MKATPVKITTITGETEMAYLIKREEITLHRPEAVNMFMEGPTARQWLRDKKWLSRSMYKNGSLSLLPSMDAHEIRVVWAVTGRRHIKAVITDADMKVIFVPDRLLSAALKAALEPSVIFDTSVTLETVMRDILGIEGYFNIDPVVQEFYLIVKRHEYITIGFYSSGGT